MRSNAAEKEGTLTEPLCTTERLTVRKFRPEDAADLAEILTDPAVTCFEPYPTFTREACAREAENFSQSDEFFAVVRNGRVIGKIYFSERESGSFELGYTFAAAFQGQGYAAESLRAFLRYAFTLPGVRRITAQIDTRNVRSVRLAERLGMRREAEHKALYPRKEDPSLYNDFYVYAILKAECL